MLVLHGIYRVACVSDRPEQVVNEAAAKTAEAAGLKVVCSVAEYPQESPSKYLEYPVIPLQRNVAGAPLTAHAYGQGQH